METYKVDILLVDDNLDDAGLTIRAFRKNNIYNTLSHLTNGEDTLNFIFCSGDYKSRNISHAPKIILLDLKMPKIDGFEVLKKIKSDERTKSIPVIILTSSNENMDIIDCYNLGANSFIVKPADFDGLVKAIASLGNYWLLLNNYPQ